MSLEPEFLEMTSDTITVAPLSTHTSYGAPQYSSSGSHTWPARVEPGTRKVLSSRGIEEVATATVYVLSSSAAIGTQDRLTLPDGRIPKVLRVDVLNDEEGQHHLEVSIS